MHFIVKNMAKYTVIKLLFHSFPAAGALDGGYINDIAVFDRDNGTERSKISRTL